jgi:hypothetical protein
MSEVQERIIQESIRKKAGQRLILWAAHHFEESLGAFHDYVRMGAPGYCEG